MISVAAAYVGPLRLRLLQRELGYYFEARHDVAPAVAAVAYLGRDPAHAERQYQRRVDNERAKQQAAGDDGC